MVRSIKYPKRTEIGIWRKYSSLKSFRRMNNCSKINKRLKTIVNCPKVSGILRLNTYGMDEMGDVPRSAFVTRLTPSELMNSPTQKIK